MYGRGTSEEIVGRAIQGRRGDVVVATKFRNPMAKGPNRGGTSRRWVMQACEDSLRRLGTDYIDLYQVHRPDHQTDVEETMSALSDLVHQGKVRLLGTSSWNNGIDSAFSRSGRLMVSVASPPESLRGIRSSGMRFPPLLVRCSRRSRRGGDAGGEPGELVVGRPEPQ